MAITAAAVKELREKTGLGMMLCKKALTEADGDMAKAIEDLRKQGQATMEKRSGKAAKEGLISVVTEGPASIMYEVNAETDFVARNEDFTAFVESLGKLLTSARPLDMEAAKALTTEDFGGQSVEAKVLELAGKIGEVISFRRFTVEEADPERERIFSYVHGGRIGVLVKLACEDKAALDGEALQALGKDLAMQVAASNPIAISREDVPADTVEKEREIYLTQAQSSGKPEKVWDRIVDGKLGKFYKEVALLEQEFIRDTDMTVSDRIQQTQKEIGSPVSAVAFTRYELGGEE